MSKKITFPCLNAKLVSAEKVVANAYNPNHVANVEMKLLAHSIEEDGLTQPVVTFYDKENDQYEVVDGFHRFTLLKHKFKCPEIPVVVIDKDIKNRMASTIRHNRARGEHQIDLMGDLVASLVEKGWEDEEISVHLGMEAEEVLRLKQQTGILELFKGREYSRSWIPRSAVPEEATEKVE